MLVGPDKSDAARLCREEWFLDLLPDDKVSRKALRTVLTLSDRSWLITFRASSAFLALPMVINRAASREGSTWAACPLLASGCQVAVLALHC